MLGESDYETSIRAQEIVPAQSEEYQSFIIKYNQNVYGPIGENVRDGWEAQIINNQFAVIYGPEERLGEPQVTSYSYNSIPKCYTCMDTGSLEASGINRLHNHPYLKLRGKGTLVAVIDTGIDYQNSVFRNGGGSKILYLWDQSIPGGPSELAPFGRVFTKQEIDRALQLENSLEAVPSTDTNGHGTALAAIAAGNVVPDEDFSGAAPEASLLIVKLKPAKAYLRQLYLLPPGEEIFQEDDIMLAVAFAVKCAQELEMPLSICLGLGTSQGSHEGHSPLSQMINTAAGYTQNSISVAAGNEGAARHHFRGELTEPGQEIRAELRVAEKSESFAMEFWGMAPEAYSITVQSPTGENLAVSTSLRGGTQDLRFVFVETRVLVDYVPIERLSGNTLVFFRFIYPAPGLWKFQVRGRDSNGSVFHMWLPVQGMISPDTYFLEASPYQTVTAPGDALDGITMTAYQHRNGSLYLEASRGFTPNQNIKPNLAAPGVGIRVPLPGGRFGIVSGTSLAAAQTAGVAALLFEWAIIRENEPFFTGISVKNYLQRGARRTDDQQYPNPDWGYGKVDLYHTFELLP